MSVVYVIGFQVAPDRVARFRALLDGVLDAMRAEDGFINAVLHQAPDDPCRFLLYETWADHDEVLAVQLHRPYRAEWNAALPDLLTAPRDISMWQPLRADGIAG